MRRRAMKLQAHRHEKSGGVTTAACSVRIDSGLDPYDQTSIPMLGLSMLASVPPSTPAAKA